MTRHDLRAHPLRRAVAVAVLVALAGCVAFVVYWAASGGHWFVVRTASMGPAAPVGTLLWVEPTSIGSLHVGDLISFHPPTAPHETYSHRILAVNADGTLSTKGDVNGSADPWQLTAHDLIGKVAMRWWGIGWLVRAAPILLIGGAMLYVLTRFFASAQWRAPAGIAGSALLVSLAVYLVKPLVGAQLISFVPVQNGAQATVVSTGLLPLRVATERGHVNVPSGHVASLRTQQKNDHDQYVVHLGAHLPWWAWVLIVLVGLLPALYTLVVGLPGQRRAGPAVS